MRKGGSSAKGASFERKICRELSLWVTHGKKEDCFWRSAMSGGRATVGKTRGKFHVHQSGDICSVSPEGHALTNQFFIEVKHLRNLDLDSFFVKGTGTLAKHWKTAAREAKSFSKLPFMVVRQNRMPILLLVPTGYEYTLRKLEPVKVTRLNALVCHFAGMLTLLPGDVLREAVADRAA